MILPGKKIKTIIADDSPAFLEGLELLLDEHGRCEIIDIVHDGEALLNSPKVIQADLILTDVEMPKMNGIEAGRKINFRFPQIKLVAMTMYLDKVYLTEILQSGFKGFIHKPNIAAELDDTISKVIADKYAFPAELLGKE